MKNQEKRDLVNFYKPILNQYLNALKKKMPGLKIEDIAAAIGMTNPNDLSRAKMKGYTSWKIRNLTLQEIVERLEQTYQIKKEQDGTLTIPGHIVENPPVWQESLRQSKLNHPHVGAHWYVALSYKHDNDIVYQGIFEFDADWKSVRVEYYRHGETDPLTQQGTVHPRDLYLLVNITAANDAYVKTQYILKKAEQGWKNSEYFHGVYSAPSFDSHPAAGEIILQRVDSLENARKLILQPAPDWAVFQLHGKYLITNTTNVVKRESDFPYHHLMEDIESISGRWQGYLQNTQDKSLHECILQINSDGQVQLKSSLYTTSVDGKLSPLESSSSFYINFGLDPQSGVSGLYLGLNFFSEGILSGVAATLLEGVSPSMFKVVLWPLEGNEDWDQLKCDDIDGLADIKNEQHRKGVLREFYQLDADALADLEGHYEVLLLSHDIIHQHSNLQRLCLTIHSDGTAHLSGAYRKQYNGHLALTRGMTVCSFSPEEEEDVYFQFFFVPVNPDDVSVYTGIFAGGEPQANVPIAGRIMLQRVEKPVSVENYALNSDKLVEYFFQHPERLDFFLGYQDKMILTYKDLWDAGLLPRSPNAREEINRVAGLYYSIKPHRVNDSPAFFVNPVRIHEDGRVDLLSTRKPKAYYHGIVELINNSMLCMTLFRRSKAPQRAVSLYNLGTQEGEHIQMIAGVHLAYRLNQAPRTSREVLIRLNPENCRKLNLDYDQLEYESLEAYVVHLPINGKQDEQYALFNQFDGVMNFLTGDEHNAIRLSADIPPRFSREVDYADLFFSAARQKAATGNLSQAIDYLERAQHHGFSNQALLTEELANGALSALNELAQNSSLFDKTFAGLQAKERKFMLEKIKALTRPGNYLSEDHQTESKEV